MAIRPRISDPYGAEAKEFDRMRREGPLPKAPDRKPPAIEREPLLECLRSVPVGTTMRAKEWSDLYYNEYITRKFTVWGIEFGVYPAGYNDGNDLKVCTGVFIKAVTRTRRGIQPMKSFKGEYSKTWYREILDWIDENYYGGLTCVNVCTP